MAITSWFLGILFVATSLETIKADSQCINARHLCGKPKNPATPSGRYLVRTVFGTVIEVYCDMETDGGGYTYVNPTFLSQLTSEEVALMFTNKTSFRFCYRKSDSTQYCAILKQLPQYTTIPLKVGLSENVDYTNPVNLNILGKPYLYFGFLPSSAASNRNVQGMQVNGVSLSFTNCDSNPNSYITLFPNYSGFTPSTYLIGTSFPFCNQIFTNSLIQPTNRLIPEYFFMFAEFHFGGCGCYTQSNRIHNVVGVAIGFK